MKNKKLFAILTLVCFMFTLMPVAAFAADPVGQVEVKASVNGSWGEKAVVEVGEDIEFQVRTAADTATTAGYLYYVVDAATGDGAYITTTANNKVTMKLPGEFEVYAVVAAGENVATLDTLVGKINALTDGKSVKEVVATVQAWATTNELLVKDYAKVIVEPKDANHAITLSGVSGTAPSQYVSVNVANGCDAAGVTVNVTNNTVAVKDAEVEIIAPAFVTVTPVEGKVTDRHGDVSYKITASKAGTYSVVFKYKDARAVKLEVRATNAVVDNVVVATEVKDKIAIASSMNTGIEFKFVDSDNVTVVSNPELDRCADNETVGVYKLSIVDQPANSTLKAADFTLLDAKTVNGTTVRDGLYELSVAGLKQAGEYTVKVTLENGKSATATFTAAEFKDVVGIKFAPTAPKTVAVGGNVTFDLSKHIVYFDINGVTKAYDAAPAVTLVANGNALNTFNGTVLTAKDNNDVKNYVGEKITVLAKDANNVFIATTEVTVVDAAMSIAYADATAEVGVNKVLAGNVYDAEGNKVATTGTVNAVIVSRPAGAYASVSVADSSKLTVTGGFTMNFIASVAGEYKVQTIIVNGNKYIASVETITVGDSTATFKDVVVVSINADKIVVNSDVVAIPAPAVIKDSRTFVPLRAVAEAFGAEVEWTPEAITAELGGVKVVMTTGDKAYTVNGVAKVADVAPYLNAEAATTMVPVSFIAQAFGINYQCIYAADGTVADVLFTK